MVDVVPFVPLCGSTMLEAIAARDRFAQDLWGDLSVPSFRYGPERGLPEVRRRAFATLEPDVGGPGPHPTAGATAVGARPVLVAYNVWLVEPDVARARQVAGRLRQRHVRALGLAVGRRVQVSMNLLEPASFGPAQAYDAVTELVAAGGAELVGLVPRAVLEAVPATRWEELDLGPERTIEARLGRTTGR